MRAIARCMLLVPLCSYFVDPRTSLATAFAPLNGYPQPQLSRRLQRCSHPRIACVSMQESSRNSELNRFPEAMEHSNEAEEDRNQPSERPGAGNAYSRRTCAYSSRPSDMFMLMRSVLDLYCIYFQIRRVIFLWCVSVSTSLHLFMLEWVIVCMWVSVCVCVCVCARVRACLYVCMYLCAYVHVHIRVGINV